MFTRQIVFRRHFVVNSVSEKHNRVDKLGSPIYNFTTTPLERVILAYTANTIFTTSMEHGIIRHLFFVTNMTWSAVSGAAERVSVNGCVTEIKAINERSTKNKNKITICHHDNNSSVEFSSGGSGVFDGHHTRFRPEPRPRRNSTCGPPEVQPVVRKFQPTSGPSVARSRAPPDTDRTGRVDGPCGPGAPWRRRDCSRSAVALVVVRA